ncbi:hypothetical protein L2E82_28244 [Cichorium intybus]|uniref:Uncharacterized protein n=1 Tax=Cichorium intybus TaxID=13427 RepID=A0ACB9CVK1_CICIN|nr:hypothetical protein L2E82_28244 [Cichorium intybus]
MTPIYVSEDAPTINILVLGSKLFQSVPAVTDPPITEVMQWCIQFGPSTAQSTSPQCPKNHIHFTSPISSNANTDNSSRYTPAASLTSFTYSVEMGATNLVHLTYSPTSVVDRKPSKSRSHSSHIVIDHVHIEHSQFPHTRTRDHLDHGSLFVDQPPLSSIHA